MTMWNPPNRNDDRDAEQRAIEKRAAHDAAQALERIWYGEIPNGDLRPIAAEFTRAYIAELRQQSIGLPRWTFSSPEAQRATIQTIGDRYYYTFLYALDDLMAQRIRNHHHVPPRTTPRLRSFPTTHDSEPSFPTPPPQASERGA